MASSLNLALQGKVCGHTDKHLSSLQLNITDVTGSQRAGMVILHACVCSLLPQHCDKKSLMLPPRHSTRFFYAQAMNTRSGATGGTKTSPNEGEGDEEPERKPRLGDIAISIYATIIMWVVLKMWLISSLNQHLITDQTVGSPRTDTHCIFSLASQSPNLKNCRIPNRQVYVHVQFTLFE